MEETEHSFTKLIVRTVVETVASGIITKVVITFVPPTQKFKIAAAVGSLVGWKIGAVFGDSLDKIVDQCYKLCKN